MFQAFCDFVEKLKEPEHKLVTIAPLSEELPIVEPYKLALYGKSAAVISKSLREHIFNSLASRLEKTRYGEQALAHQCILLFVSRMDPEPVTEPERLKSAMERQGVIYYTLDKNLVQLTSHQF